MAFEWDILHPSKHFPFLYDFVKYGVDWSGAAFKMTFADMQGGTIVAAMTLTNASAGSQGVSATYDPDAVHPKTGARVGATRMTVQEDEATLEAATFPAAPAPLVKAYDFLVTPSGGPQQCHAFGVFTCNPGVGD